MWQSQLGAEQVWLVCPQGGALTLLCSLYQTQPLLGQRYQFVSCCDAVVMPRECGSHWVLQLDPLEDVLMCGW